MMEDNGAVYRLWDIIDFIYGQDVITGQEFRFCYHTDLQSPLKLKVSYRYDALAESRGIIELSGKLRRAVKVRIDDPEGIRYDYWVEGIGPLLGMVPYYPFPIQHGPTPYSKVVRLKKCYDGDELIYDGDEFSHDLYTEVERFMYTD